jgi:tetratricopeptide (TPR) repeat protein
MIKKLGGTFGIVLAIVGIIEAIGLTFDILPRQAPLPTLTQDHILRARTEPGYQSYMWAVTNCLTGDYDKAIKQLTETIELEPTFAEAYYYRGLVYIHLGRLERGVADLETVVELTPHLGLRRDARKELLLTRMADVLVPVHFVSLLGIVILMLVGEKARRFTVVAIMDVLVYLFTAVFFLLH